MYVTNEKKIWFRELRIKNLNRELSVPLPYQIAKHPSVALTHSLIFHDFIVILLFYVQLFRDDQIQIRFIKNIILLKRLLLMIQLNWFAEQVLHFFVTEISLEIKPCDWWHVEVRSQNFISVILVSLSAFLIFWLRLNFYNFCLILILFSFSNFVVFVIFIIIIFKVYIVLFFYIVYYIFYLLIILLHFINFILFIFSF